MDGASERRDPTKQRTGRRPSSCSRREFLQTGTLSAISTVGGLSIARTAHAAGSSLIRLALIGCGGRGGGAVTQALRTSGPVRLVAMADVFADRIEDSLKYLLKIDAVRHRIDVPPERRFVGFDAYRKAIDCGVDMVILATPPGFRPLHYAAAVKAGKHVYMETPVAVDAPGVRAVEAANVVAKKAGLKVAVGFQRRYETDCRDALRRVRDGQLGPVRLIRSYYLMDGPMGGAVRRPDETEMEYQLRHWLYFTWLSGDHFVEQSVHAVDLANWIANAKPLKAQALGGRQVRVGKGAGQIFDHGVVEYEYPDNCRAIAFARQIAGCYSYLGQHVQGTKGDLKLGVGMAALLGKMPLKTNPYQLQHDRLFTAIRHNEPFFEAAYGASSTMAAIMGRMALYSGKEVTWAQAMESKLSLAPARYALDANPPVLPDKNGYYPVAVPGMTVAW
jgi:predicted dehydrogenase